MSVRAKRRYSSYSGSQPGNPKYMRTVYSYGGRRKGRGRAGSLKIPKINYRKSLTWRGPGLLPEKLITHPKYQFWYTATTGTGFYDWVIRGNSIYDPDYALGGQTTGGFTSIMGLYTRWNVHASAIRVRAVNNDADDPVDITIFPTKTAGAYSQGNHNAIRGYPLSKFVICSNQHGNASINHYAKTKDVCGVKDDSDEGFIGVGNADPTHQWYWHICVHNHTADHALNVQLWLEVEYTCEFSDHYPWTQASI